MSAPLSWENVCHEAIENPIFVLSAVVDLQDVRSLYALTWGREGRRAKKAHAGWSAVPLLPRHIGWHAVSFQKDPESGRVSALLPTDPLIAFPGAVHAAVGV